MDVYVKYIPHWQSYNGREWKDHKEHWECTCDDPAKQVTCIGYKMPISPDQTAFCHWSHDREGRVTDWCGNEDLQIVRRQKR